MFMGFFEDGRRQSATDAPCRRESPAAKAHLSRSRVTKRVIYKSRSVYPESVKQWSKGTEFHSNPLVACKRVLLHQSAVKSSYFRCRIRIDKFEASIGCSRDACQVGPIRQIRRELNLISHIRNGAAE